MKSFGNSTRAVVLGGICGLAVLGSAALAQTQVPDAQLSPFGIGCSALRSRDQEKWIPQMGEIGIKTMRACGGSGWHGEASQDWTTLDTRYAYLKSQGFSTGATLICARPGKKGFPMDDLPGWSAYVESVVGHAKGKIKYWEVWNEPPNGTNNAPASDYAKLMVASYNAAKKADPQCLVGLAAKSVHVNYLYQAIRAGAKDHFDYLTLHPYETLGCAVDQPGAEPVFMSIVPTVRKMLADQNPAKVNIPIIFTELGYDSKRGIEKQAYNAVKAYTMSIAQGVACLQWFEGMDGDSGPLGLIQADGKPRPAYTALGQLIKYLGQHPVYLGWVLLNEKDYGFVFQGAKNTAMVTWAPVRDSDTLNFGQPVQIVNTLAGTTTQASTYALTEAPIIVDGVPANLVALAREHKNKPLPWGGDYTNAKSVSVTFGEQNVEKGLHTKSAASIAADVVAYGGNARVGTVPGGNVFMVDPNFLSYTSKPIELSIVVRRNPNNDPSKLVLEYESTSGYKKLPAYDVPESQDWSTAKWRIDDSQFVSMWGFSFRLNTGKYCIQSVTVTKL